MRRVSLNRRVMQDAAHSGEVEVALIYIDHPALEAPLRFSTDNADQISLDPLAFGTRSTWMDSDPVTEPFLYILASADLPSDLEDDMAGAAIVLHNLNSKITQLLHSFTDQASAAMAVVLASSPDVVERQHRKLYLTEARGNAGEISLIFERPDITDEEVPMDRFTKARFPGMFS